MRLAEIERGWHSTGNTYKAQVRVPSPGGYNTTAVWVTVTAESDWHARSMLEALYCRGSIVCMPSRVPRSVGTNEDAQAATPGQQRVQHMKDNAKVAQQKAKQLKAQADAEAARQKVQQTRQALASATKSLSNTTTKPQQV